MRPGFELGLLMQEEVRRKIFNFILNVLGEPRFDPGRAGEYCA